MYQMFFEVPNNMTLTLLETQMTNHVGANVDE